MKVDNIKRNQGKKEFVFRIDDIPKPYQEGRFGLEGWKRPHLDELLKKIQDEDHYVQLLGNDRFLLRQEGIERCLEFYPSMR
jgi:hypothetical protein